MKQFNEDLDNMIADSSIKEETKRNILLLKLIKKHLY